MYQRIKQQLLDTQHSLTAYYPEKDTFNQLNNLNVFNDIIKSYYNFIWHISKVIMSVAKKTILVFL